MTVQQIATVPADETVRSVCVGIPTFRRLTLLKSLLEGLAQQKSLGSVKVEILVIDNAPDGCAKPVVEAMREGFPFPLHYVNVVEPGLCVVRNYALSFAAARFDLLAMIDDDETPESQWLSELLRVQRATGADAVVGPVPARFPEDAEAWTCVFRNLALVTAGDCEPISEGYSGNCLLALDSVRRLDMRFDQAFNLAGGEDSYFFRQLRARGGAIVFAAEATASELIPPERLTARHMLRRSFRMGNTLAFCDLKLYGTFPVIALRVLKGVGFVLRGSMRFILPALRRDKAGMVMSACEAARGLGMLVGLFGQTLLEYKR
ncbi:MAG: glycosyltransferase family 2 protein [Vulcanimicrobiaceae bacterium]